MNEQAVDLKLFLTLFGQLDMSQCEFTDIPDLLVSQKDRVIGVEHTRIYRENPALPSGRQLRPQESLQFQLVERAHQLFKQQSDHFLHATVSFEEPFNHKRQTIEGEAQILTQSILAAMSHLQSSPPEEQTIIIHARQAQRLGIPWPSGQPH